MIQSTAASTVFSLIIAVKFRAASQPRRAPHRHDGALPRRRSVCRPTPRQVRRPEARIGRIAAACPGEAGEADEQCEHQRRQGGDDCSDTEQRAHPMLLHPHPRPRFLTLRSSTLKWRTRYSVLVQRDQVYVTKQPQLGNRSTIGRIASSV